VDVGQDLEQLGEIHRGRRFVVRRARRTADGSTVVTKSIRPDCLDAAEAAARLEREYHLLDALAVPGATRPLALERIEGQPLLVLEDAGPTLHQRLSGRPVPLATFLAMAQELAQVLARLHAHQIIHREIDPTNVVVDRDDHATWSTSIAPAAWPAPEAGSCPSWSRSPPSPRPRPPGGWAAWSTRVRICTRWARSSISC
jgi:serine/threonine protein kinase